MLSMVVVPLIITVEDHLGMIDGFKFKPFYYFTLNIITSLCIRLQIGYTPHIKVLLPSSKHGMGKIVFAEGLGNAKLICFIDN
jgi:hypothetical protein